MIFRLECNIFTGNMITKIVRREYPKASEMVDGFNKAFDHYNSLPDKVKVLLIARDERGCMIINKLIDPKI